MTFGWSLRGVRDDDRERLFRWRNDPRVRRFMTNDAAIERDRHDAWFEATLAGTRELFVFEHDGEALGVMQFVDLDRSGRRARWGFYLRPEAAPPGSGSRMGWLALAHAFGRLGLHRVGAEVARDNERSVRLHRRLGFREEGVLRDYVRRDDGWRDLLLFSLLEEEWREREGRLREDLFG